MKVPIFILALVFAQDCEKANFAAVDCDSYDFTVTINQTCFDQHFNRGNTWNETIIFGTSGNSSCEFIVSDQGLDPKIVKFDECDVLPTYPDSTDKNKITFKLDGIVRETLNIELESDAEIVTDFEFDFQCRFEAVSDIQQIASLYAADMLKINTTLTLNGTEVLPAPEVCAYENGVCDENNQLKVGEYYKIDYSNQVDSTLSFRIESIWAGRDKGDKDVKLVENGCTAAFFPSDKIDAYGLTYEWAAFKFRDQDEIHFTIQFDLCDPDDSTYCKGATDCANGVGNQELFDQFFENDTARRRRSADENDRDYQQAADISVSVKIPDNAKTVEDVVDGEEIVRISAEDFIVMADGQQAAFSFAFTFIFALLL